MLRRALCYHISMCCWPLLSCTLSWMCMSACSVWWFIYWKLTPLTFFGKKNMASSTNTRDEEAYLRQHGLQGQRLSIWEVLGIVSTFRQNVERLKLYKATLSVIRFMAVLNFIYTVVGTAFLIIGLIPHVHRALGINEIQSQQFLKLGKFLLKNVQSHRLLNSWKYNQFIHTF